MRAGASSVCGLEADYAKLGGWQRRHAGYLDEDDTAFPGYVGALAWSEADIQHRFANHLSEQFRSLESGGRSGAAGKWPPQQHIDTVVTTPNVINGWRRPDAERTRSCLRSQQHLAFVEVKWFHKGSTHWEKHNWKAEVVEGVQPDLDRLEQHLAVGRCLLAAMLLVDDTGSI